MVLYVDILVYANTTNEIYDVHIVSKMSKTWLGFRSLQFFGYQIMRPNIELTQDLNDNIQAICFLKIRKQILGSSLLSKDFVPNYSLYASILHDTTDKYFN